MIWETNKEEVHDNIYKWIDSKLPEIRRSKTMGN